jgi:SecD/SecF fusion protein
LTFLQKNCYRYGYFKRADIKILLTAEQRYAKFVWETNNCKDAKIKMLMQLNCALKGNRDNVAAMSGGVVTDASDSFDQSGNLLYLCK